MKFNQKKFNEFVVEENILGFFPEPIKLSSGRVSQWYVNWRNVAEDVYLIDRLSDWLLEFLDSKHIEFDCIYGTPDGATKLAVLAQYKWARGQEDYARGKYVMAMGRKTPKDHGEVKDRFFVGMPRGRVVVIEDVTTTGGSLLKAVVALKDAGVKVLVAIALTNRNEVMDDGKHVAWHLKQVGVKYMAMSQGVDLLPLVYRLKPNDKVKESIVKEFAQYGEMAVKWVD